jgi:hypothetical protein
VKPFTLLDPPPCLRNGLAHLIKHVRRRRQRTCGGVSERVGTHRSPDASAANQSVGETPALTQNGAFAEPRKEREIWGRRLRV